MGIAFTKYVDIVSSVGGGVAVSTRELIGRIFTTNILVPTKTLIEFTSAADVGAYFGTDSELYKRAVFYFGWVSKRNTRARKLGIARWVDEDTSALILGAPGTYAVNQFTGITHGHFVLVLEGVNYDVGPVDLSGAVSLAAVAAAVQVAARTALQPLGVSPALVTFDAQRGAFDFDTNDTSVVPRSIALTDGAQDLGRTLGWKNGAVFSAGAAVEDVVDMLTASVTASNNFGSFLFDDVVDLNLAKIQQVAEWNAGQNVDFQYTVSVRAADAVEWSAALIETAGVELTLKGSGAEWHEMMPMVLLATTPYTVRNGTRNYMFQRFPSLTPSVSDTATSDTYDNLRINYLGVTQTAGNTLAFYQRGVMMGDLSAPVDMNVYANEQWLKDALGAAIMSLLIAVEKVSANEAGRAKLVNTLMSVIDNNGPFGVGAVQNGTISVGKALTQLQVTVIGELSDDPDAWRQVAIIGYWLNVAFEQYQTDDDHTETKAIYTLIYSKDDTVRKVEGSHVLI